MAISKTGLTGFAPGSISTLIDRIDAEIAAGGVAALTHNYIFVGNSDDEATGVAQSGDVSVSDAGVFAITAGAIVNADVNTNAAIAFSKLAALASGNILVGSAGNVATSVDPSGDVDISNTGAFTVTGITLGSDAQGDIYYRGASGLARLAAGTAGQSLVTAGAGSNPYWGEPSSTLASKLTNTYSIESGTYDIVHAVTTQTSSAPTLTIPDFAGVADTYVFKTKAETLANKTLTTPKIVTTGAICDAGGDEYLKFVEATTPVTYVQITSGDTGVAPKVQGGGETNTDLHLLGSGTGNVYISDGTDPTKDVTFEVSGATTAKTTTLTFVHTDDRAITFPDFDGTLATLAGTETLAGKTLTTPKIVTTGSICDAGGDEYVVFTEAATPVTYIGITSGDTGVAPQVRGAGEANTGLLIAGTGTGNVTIGDGADITKLVEFSNVGATTAKTTTLTFVHSDDRTITFPNANCTLVGKDTTDTLTNKTFDCNGTGNALSNVNVDELDSVALSGTAVTGVPFTIVATVTNLAEAGANLLQDSTVKYLIYGAEFINTSAPDASATWQLCQGSVGAIGTAITEAVAADNADKIKTTALSFDDSVSTIASGASGDLCVIGDASGTLDGIIIVHCVRID